MRTTFEIDGTIGIGLPGEGCLDLHNDFDFIGFEYQPTDQKARLSWRRGDGDWIAKRRPTEFFLLFAGVRSFTVRKRDTEMPFSEDSCLQHVTFAPADFADDYDAIFPTYRALEEHLSLAFMSGFGVKIWAESVAHESKRPNKAPEP